MPLASSRSSPPSPRSASRHQHQHNISQHVAHAGSGGTAEPAPLARDKSITHSRDLLRVTHGILSVRLTVRARAREAVPSGFALRYARAEEVPTMFIPSKTPATPHHDTRAGRCRRASEHRPKLASLEPMWNLKDNASRHPLGKPLDIFPRNGGAEGDRTPDLRIAKAKDYAAFPRQTTPLLPDSCRNP